jgi:DNA-damage-inducible protein D
VECWSARDLQGILGYTEWRNFLKVIDKAKEACRNSEAAVTHQFVDGNKLITLGRGLGRRIEDFDTT